MPVEIIFPTPRSSIASDGPVFVVVLADASVADIAVECYKRGHPKPTAVGVRADVGPVNGRDQWTFLLDLAPLGPHGDFVLSVVWTDKAGIKTPAAGEFTVHPVPKFWATASTHITSPTIAGPIPTSNYVTTGTFAVALDTGNGGVTCCTTGFPCLCDSSGTPVARTRLVTLNHNWSATYASVTASRTYTERVKDRTSPSVDQTLPGLTT
jgi:hypothetical protein